MLGSTLDTYADACLRGNYVFFLDDRGMRVRQGHIYVTVRVSNQGFS